MNNSRTKNILSKQSKYILGYPNGRVGVKIKYAYVVMKAMFI